MLRSMTLALTLLGWFAAAAGADQQNSPVRIHMLSGSQEYQSDVSLPKWAKQLAAQGYQCTIATSMDEQSRENLAAADLLVVFCKRWQLPEEELEAIKDYIASGRPILGIRTASHAFQTYLKFDNEVLGGTYSGHSGTVEADAARVEANLSHPVLNSITKDWKWTGKIYYNHATGGGKQGSPKTEFAQDAAVLVRLKHGEIDTPGVWVRELKGGQRVFYTSMGYTNDFEDPTFMRLLDNAVKWCLNRSDQK